MSDRTLSIVMRILLAANVAYLYAQVLRWAFSV